MELDSNTDIGSMLLEKKLISTEQLIECFDQQKIKGGYLSQHLLDAGYIKDSDLTTCLTCQYGYCYLPIKSYYIEDAALKAIPTEYVYDYCAIPIEKKDKLLSVVMADPINKGVIEMLRRVSRCEIVVFISNRNDVKETIEKCYGMTFENFELDKFKEDTVLRDNFSKKEIETSFYEGPNRRRYRRLYYDMDLEYYAYPHAIRTKILNISMSGILFESNVAIPKGMQIAVNIHLDGHMFVTGVVEVARCGSIQMQNTVFGDDSPTFYFYEVGAFFNFLTRENQTTMAEFLRKKLDM
ncbi:MAG TPA: hypothetical protein DCL35_00705 [Candidatus Omnitrophica bacterium]|nr:hypothetical protein [Candidatus Omnitrophota bacterium]